MCCSFIFNCLMVSAQNSPNVYFHPATPQLIEIRFLLLQTASSTGELHLRLNRTGATTPKPPSED